MNSACSPRFSIVGRRSSLRMGQLPSSGKHGPTIQPSRSGSHTWRKRSRRRTSSGRADGGARRAKKRHWGTLTGSWVPHDTRDQVVDFVRCWSEKTEIGAGRFIGWLDITASKFYDWRERYGKVNEHNGWVPRDFWLADWEKQAIVGFHLKNPLEGYRRLTFMMLDADIVAVSPTSVWRVLG